MRILPPFAALLAGALATCTANQKGTIVPGEPFVVLHNMDAFLTRLAERGWTVKSIGKGRLVAENVAPAVINTAARQAGYARPWICMTVIGVAAGSNIELIVDPFVVTIPARLTNVSNQLSPLPRCSKPLTMPDGT